MNSLSVLCYWKDIWKFRDCIFFLMCIKMRQPRKIQAEESMFVSMSACTTSWSCVNAGIFASYIICYCPLCVGINWCFFSTVLSFERGFRKPRHRLGKSTEWPWRPALTLSEVGMALLVQSWALSVFLCSLRVLQVVCSSSSSSTPLLEPSRRRQRAGGAHLSQKLFVSPQPPWTPGRIVMFPLRKHHGWCQSFLSPKSFFCTRLQVRLIEAGFFW